MAHQAQGLPPHVPVPVAVHPGIRLSHAADHRLQPARRNIGVLMMWIGTLGIFGLTCWKILEKLPT
jgi:hypothetical protein